MLDLSSPTEGSPAYLRIAEAVCEAIRSGRFQPGDALPPQTELAKQLGLSSSCVGNAYQWLADQGIVAGKRGLGTRIQANALHRLEQKRAPHFSSIVVVIGAPCLADCEREYVFLLTQILAGVGEVLGEQKCSFMFVERLDWSYMNQMPPDSAVLVRNDRYVDAATVDELTRNGIPVVSIWHAPSRLHVPLVPHNPFQAVDLACRHLIDCGYRRIGYIGQKHTENTWLGVKFLQFTNTLHDAGLDFQARDTRQVGAELGRAYRAAWDMAHSGDPPEALFVDTDFKAIEVLYALQDAGLKVPDDIGVIGYDDMPEAARCDPPLTTVHIPRKQIGRRAAQFLLDWPGREALPASNNPLEHAPAAELVIRQTTRPVPAHVFLSSRKR